MKRSRNGDTKQLTSEEKDEEKSKKKHLKREALERKQGELGNQRRQTFGTLIDIARFLKSAFLLDRICTVSLTLVGSTCVLTLPCIIERWPSSLSHDLSHIPRNSAIDERSSRSTYTAPTFNVLHNYSSSSHQVLNHETITMQRLWLRPLVTLATLPRLLSLEYSKWQVLKTSEGIGTSIGMPVTLPPLLELLHKFWTFFIPALLDDTIPFHSRTLIGVEFRRAPSPVRISEFGRWHFLMHSPPEIAGDTVLSSYVSSSSSSSSPFSSSSSSSSFSSSLSSSSSSFSSSSPSSSSSFSSSSPSFSSSHVSSSSSSSSFTLVPKDTKTTSYSNILQLDHIQMISQRWNSVKFEVRHKTSTVCRSGLAVTPKWCVKAWTNTESQNIEITNEVCRVTKRHEYPCDCRNQYNRDTHNVVNPMARDDTIVYVLSGVRMTLMSYLGIAPLVAFVMDYGGFVEVVPPTISFVKL